MARYSGARWLPIPENSTQAHITPIQLILHSVAAPWGEDRIRSFWNEAGVVTESHFGLDYDGSMGQYIDTSVRADANMAANNHAISMESAANVKNSDRWTAAQITQIVKLMVWAHKTHSIPARICRTSSDPGFGIHNMFAVWSGGGTACPGSARTVQFKTEVFPKFLKALNATPEAPAPTKPFLYVTSVQLGKTNASVKVAQTALINKGFKIADGPTGYFGAQTAAAYKAYQVSLYGVGPDSDGKPGVDSLQKLLPNYKVA